MSLSARAWTYHCKDCDWKRMATRPLIYGEEPDTWLRSCPHCRSAALACRRSGEPTLKQGDLPGAWRRTERDF